MERFFPFFSRYDGGERGREDRLAASFCIIFSPHTINHPLGLAGWFMFCPRETRAFVADRRSRPANRYAPDNSRINFPRCSRVCIIISRGQFQRRCARVRAILSRLLKSLNFSSNFTRSLIIRHNFIPKNLFLITVTSASNKIERNLSKILIF